VRALLNALSTDAQRYAGSRAISGRVAIITDPSGCDDQHGDLRSSLLQDGQSMQQKLEVQSRQFNRSLALLGSPAILQCDGGPSAVRPAFVFTFFHRRCQLACARVSAR
jgi:hypothetical protein